MKVKATVKVDKGNILSKEERDFLKDRTIKKEITKPMRIDEIKRMYAEQKESNNRQVVSLRLRKQSIDKAKNLGKGYTGILASILEYTLERPDMIEMILKEL